MKNALIDVSLVWIDVNGLEASQFSCTDEDE